MAESNADIQGYVDGFFGSATLYLNKMRLQAEQKTENLQKDAGVKQKSLPSIDRAR